MKFKAVLFDFNGTLFQDTKFHLEAWRQYSKKLRGYPFTDDEMIHHMLGRTNDLIIEYCIGKKPEKEFSIKCGAEKEALYREILKQTPKNIKLTNGATELLNTLKEKNIPINIATGSEKTNLDFFINVFNLKQWFDTSKIVYDDGKINGKPHPDIYINAAKNLNIKPQECIVFEDALSGVNSASTAGIGKIIVIAPKENRSHFELNKNINNVITDFTEISLEDLFE